MTRPEDRITALQRELNRRDEQIAALARELAILRASRSWRWTAFLRGPRKAAGALRPALRRAAGAAFRLLPAPVRRTLRFR